MAHRHLRWHRLQVLFLQPAPCHSLCRHLTPRLPLLRQLQAHTRAAHLPRQRRPLWRIQSLIMRSTIFEGGVMLRPSPKSRTDTCICHPMYITPSPHSIFTCFYTVLYHSGLFCTILLCSTTVCTCVYIPTINTAIPCTLVPIFCNLTCPSSPYHRNPEPCP